jgi:hypothetical protein
VGGPRDCPKRELLSLHLLSMGRLGISLNLGPKISHTLLGIIENRQVPTGTDFIFICEHPFTSFWSKTGLIIPENQAVQNHLLTLHTFSSNQCSMIPLSMSHLTCVIETRTSILLSYGLSGIFCECLIGGEEASRRCQGSSCSACNAWILIAAHLMQLHAIERCSICVFFGFQDVSPVSTAYLLLCAVSTLSFPKGVLILEVEGAQ